MGHLPTIEIVGPPGRVVVNECDCDAYIRANGGPKKWKFIDPETNKATSKDPRPQGADETSHPASAETVEEPVDTTDEAPTPDPEV